MAIMKLAAGFAVGYVLGARAGRGAYEQIASAAREWGIGPEVQRAQKRTTRAKSGAKPGTKARPASAGDKT